MKGIFMGRTEVTVPSIKAIENDGLEDMRGVHKHTLTGQRKRPQTLMSPVKEYAVNRGIRSTTAENVSSQTACRS